MKVVAEELSQYVGEFGDAGAGGFGDALEAQLVGGCGSHGRFVLLASIGYNGVYRWGIINPVGFDNRGWVADFARTSSILM